MKNSSRPIPLKRKINSEVPTDVNTLTDQSIPSKRPRIDLPFQAYVEEAAMIAKAEPQFTDWPFNKHADYDKDYYDYDDKFDDAGSNNDASLGEPNGNIPINCCPSSPVDATFKEIVNNSPSLSANDDRPCGENGWTLNGDYNWSNGSYRCPQVQILDRETPSVVLPHAPVEIITCGLVPSKSTANSTRPAFEFYMPSDLQPSVGLTSTLSVKSATAPKLLKRRKSKTSITKLSCVNNHYMKRAIGDRSSACSRHLGTGSPLLPTTSLPPRQTSTSTGSVVSSLHNGNTISTVRSPPTHVPLCGNDLNPKTSVLNDAQAPGIKLRINLSNGSVTSAGNNCSSGTTGFQEQPTTRHVHSPSHSDQTSIVRNLASEDVIAAVSAVVHPTAVSCLVSTPHLTSPDAVTGNGQHAGSDTTSAVPSVTHSHNSRHSSTAPACLTEVPPARQTFQRVEVSSQLTSIIGEERFETTTPAIEHPASKDDLPQLFPSTAPSLTTASIEPVLSNATVPTKPSCEPHQLTGTATDGHKLHSIPTNSVTPALVSAATKSPTSLKHPMHPEDSGHLMNGAISGTNETIAVAKHDSMLHNGVTRCVSSRPGAQTASQAASNVSMNDTERSGNENCCTNNVAIPVALDNGSSDGVRGIKRKLSAGGVTQAGDVELNEIEVTRDNSAEMYDSVCVTEGSGNENRCINNEAMPVAVGNGSGNVIRGKKRKLSAGGVIQAGVFGPNEIEVTRDNSMKVDDGVSKVARDTSTGAPSFEDGNIFQRLKCIVK